MREGLSEGGNPEPFERALGTLARADKGPLGPPPHPRLGGGGPRARPDKGPITPPPVLAEPMRTVVDIVAGRPDVITTTHWHRYRASQVDGVDFYVGEEELGHIHLDGAIHLATSPTQGAALMAENRARPFRHVRGWVEEEIRRIGADAAVALFRYNYDRLCPG